MRQRPTMSMATTESPADAATRSSRPTLTPARADCDPRHAAKTESARPWSPPVCAARRL
jgi:hypothetical protein